MSSPDRSSQPSSDAWGRTPPTARSMTWSTRYLSCGGNLAELRAKMYPLQIDVDGSGNIEFDQFVSFALRLFSQEGDHEREVMEMFRR